MSDTATLLRFLDSADEIVRHATVPTDPFDGAEVVGKGLVLCEHLMALCQAIHAEHQADRRAWAVFDPAGHPPSPTDPPPPPPPPPTEDPPPAEPPSERGRVQ